MDQEKEREEKFKILKEIFKTHAHFEHARGREKEKERDGRNASRRSRRERVKEHECDEEESVLSAKGWCSRTIKQ